MVAVGEGYCKEDRVSKDLFERSLQHFAGRGLRSQCGRGMNDCGVFVYVPIDVLSPAQRSMCWRWA